jgi:RNA polymerase sigma factor FliA
MSVSRVRSGPLAAYRAATSGRGDSEQEQAILRHLPLVQTVVDRIAAHLPANVDRDDLFHAGVIGLIDAVRRFDASRDNAFSTYAVLRIRGQVIDELRSRDWVSRGARERAKAWQDAVNRLHTEKGRLPTDAELAEALGIAPEDLDDVEREASLAAQVSLEAPVGEEGRLGDSVTNTTADAEDPASLLDREDRRTMLLSVLQTLSEQERQVVKLYYFENLLMKEIADLLGVTESRICQVHSRILSVLRLRLGARGFAW